MSSTRVDVDPAVAAVVPPPADPPACAETTTDTGAWPRATGFVRVELGSKSAGVLVQRVQGGSSELRLRFLGTHVFDLLDKLVHEGATIEDRRRIACTVLDAVARTGARVVRLWGSLKRTGDEAEVEAAAGALGLVLDENARRARPLRFVVTLLNHQAGYGAPRTDLSLDDQDPKSGWNARTVYLEDGWRSTGNGQLAHRIERLASRESVRGSPYVLAWELVNELDTFRVAGGGSFVGTDAERLRDRFLVPAAELLASRFPQPIAFGELRGDPGPTYQAWARSLVAALSSGARSRLLWTSHVYAPRGGDIASATRKLDADLAIAADLGLPFFLGELGQHVPGATARFCGEGPAHDLEPLFEAVLAPRPGAERRSTIDKAFFWGEGLCDVVVQHPGREQAIRVGAGGDTADLAPSDTAARAAVVARRRDARFESSTSE